MKIDEIRQVNSDDVPLSIILASACSFSIMSAMRLWGFYAFENPFYTNDSVFFPYVFLAVGIALVELPYAWIAIAVPRTVPIGLKSGFLIVACILVLVQLKTFPTTWELLAQIPFVFIAASILRRNKLANWIILFIAISAFPIASYSAWFSLLLKNVLGFALLASVFSGIPRFHSGYAVATLVFIGVSRCVFNDELNDTLLNEPDFFPFAMAFTFISELQYIFLYLFLRALAGSRNFAACRGVFGIDPVRARVP